MLNDGALVIYHERPAELKLTDGDKILLRLDNGSEKKVRSKDVEFIHAGPVKSLPPALIPLTMSQEELTELIGDLVLSWNEFMELAFGGNSAEIAWSLFCEIKNGCFFEGNVVSGVKCRSVEERERLRTAKLAKDSAKHEHEALLERLKKTLDDSIKFPLNESDRIYLREAEHVALGQAENSKLLKELGIECIASEAHKFLLKIGAWSIINDPWPVRLGVDLESVPGAIPLKDDLETIREEISVPAYAIDDVGSNDPDDAISWYNGHLLVHVADPMSALFEAEDILSIARERGVTGYLPYGIYPMLPADAVGRFGLGLNDKSIALTFELEITADGEAKLVRFFGSRIVVTRLTYEEVRPLAETPDFLSIRKALQRFMNRRAEDGACFIQLPEVKVHLNEDNQVEITPYELTPERELVANAMLAAGSAVATYFAQNGISAPFVKQNEPEDALPDGDTLSVMFARRRAMTTGVVDAIPGRHSGLGLEPYVRVTSPLRRYADLLSHRQLHAVLTGKELLDFETIQRYLTISEEATAKRGKLEKYSRDYFTEVFLLQHPDWTGEGVVVNFEGGRYTVCIPELAYEYKFRTGARLPLDSKVKLKFQNAYIADLVTKFSVEI